MRLHLFGGLARGEARVGAVELELLPAPHDHTGGEGGGVLGERHRDREVRHGNEGLALGLALHDDPQRDRLHAPGGEAAPDVVPEQLRDLVADQPVDDAPGLLRAHPVLRDLPGLLDRAGDRRLRDLVELGAVERGLRRLLLQQLVQVPADRLALAVGVGGEVDALGLAGELDELGDRLLLAGDDAVLRLVVLRAVDRDALLLEVAHVAVAGRDLEVLAEELPEGGGLGRRFDDDEGACHGNRDTLPCLSSPPGADRGRPGGSRAVGDPDRPIKALIRSATCGHGLRADRLFTPCTRPSPSRALRRLRGSPPRPPTGRLPDGRLVRWREGPCPDARGRSAGQERGVAPRPQADQGPRLQHRAVLDLLGERRACARRVPPRHPRRAPLPRRGGGPEGRRPGLHGLGARVGGAAAPGLALRQLERPGDPARSPRRATAWTTPACARPTSPSTRRWRAAPARAPPSSASTCGASPTSSTGRTPPTSRTPSSASAATPWRASASG